MGGKGSGKHGNQGRNPVPVEKKKKHYNTRLEPVLIEKLKNHALPAAMIIHEALTKWFEKND